jgi:putative FmdB family regulatory protein
MPTYEFRCPKGHEFEKFYRSMSGAPLEAPCPTCGKIAERQMSAGAGLVFKGSGFYITDYGKDGKKSAASATESGATGAKGGADTGGAKSEPVVKAESKPAAEPKSSSESKPTTASKSAAKKSSGRAKTGE